MNLEKQVDRSFGPRIFSKAIVQHFCETLKNPNFNNENSIEELFSKNLYFMTVGFHLDQIPSRQNPSGLLKEFGRYYFDLMRQTYGNNLVRKKQIQPLIYAFVNFEGTRRSGRIDASKTLVPHLHGLALVKPNTQDVFAKINNGSMIGPSIDSIKKIEFSPYKAERSSVERLNTYAMKGCFRVDQADAGAGDLWDIFPRL